MKLHTVTLENPIFGTWQIFTDLPEHMFNKIYFDWCNHVDKDRICKESLCQHILKFGYTAVTEEVYNLLFK